MKPKLFILFAVLQRGMHNFRSRLYHCIEALVSTRGIDSEIGMVIPELQAA